MAFMNVFLYFLYPTHNNKTKRHKTLEGNAVLSTSLHTKALFWPAKKIQRMFLRKTFPFHLQLYRVKSLLIGPMLLYWK